MWRFAFRSAVVLGGGALAVPVAYSAAQVLGNELRPDSQYDVYMPAFPKLVKQNSERMLDRILRPKTLGGRIRQDRIEFACFQPLAGPSKKDFVMDARLGLDGFDVLRGDPMTLYCPYDIVAPHRTILVQLPVSGASADALCELVKLTSSGERGFRRYELALAVQDFYCANKGLVKWRELDFLRYDGVHELDGRWLPVYRAFLFNHDSY